MSFTLRSPWFRLASPTSAMLTIDSTIFSLTLLERTLKYCHLTCKVQSSKDGRLRPKIWVHHKHCSPVSLYTFHSSLQASAHIILFTWKTLPFSLPSPWESRIYLQDRRYKCLTRSEAFLVKQSWWDWETWAGMGRVLDSPVMRAYSPLPVLAFLLSYGIH